MKKTLSHFVSMEAYEAYLKGYNESPASACSAKATNHKTIMKDLEAAETVRDLLETISAAIAAGDWKVDGACDPDMAIERAETFMRDCGYRLDGLTGTEWIYEG